MRTPDEVALMQRLHGLGLGTRRIAAEVGCNRETVQRYLATGGWVPSRVPTRPSLLAGHVSWLAERLRRHRGNAGVVRLELAAELGIAVSLRTVERAVSHLRRELAAEALATVRFETPPGRQLQIDFGQRRIAVEGEDPGRVFLFVATLGYLRRVYARAFRHERQSAWLKNANARSCASNTISCVSRGYARTNNVRLWHSRRCATLTVTVLPPISTTS